MSNSEFSIADIHVFVLLLVEKTRFYVSVK